MKASKFLLGALIVMPCWAAAAVAQTQPKIVAYVPNWIDLAAFSRNIDYARLTHINIAFENPVNASGELSFTPNNDALVKMARAHQVKVLVSIGGGSASEDPVMRKRYGQLLAMPARPHFVERLAAYLDRHHLDGLDVDLEGPAINADYGAFVSDLAATLRRAGKLLTAALSQGYGGTSVPNAAFEAFDFVNIMAYDATGAWDPTSPGPHSSVEFAISSTEYWLNRGLPKQKTVLGIPFYGRGFGRAGRAGEYSYASIIEKYPGAEMSDQAGSTIWFNGIPTVRAKAKYVLEKHLAGVMVWSLDSDATGSLSLLSEIHKTLTSSATHSKRP